MQQAYSDSILEQYRPIQVQTYSSEYAAGLRCHNEGKKKVTKRMCKTKRSKWGIFLRKFLSCNSTYAWSFGSVELDPSKTAELCKYVHTLMRY